MWKDGSSKGGHSMKKIIPVFLAAAVFSILLTACADKNTESSAADAPEYVFTYAENQAEDYPTTQGAYKFAELVRQRTDGRIEIQVNAGGILGDERTVIE